MIANPAQIRAMNASPDLWRSAVGEVLGAAREITVEEIQRRRECPCTWAVFHRLNRERLPRWRWLARAWHKMMGRRMETMCESS